jgi:hypothetical protein
VSGGVVTKYYFFAGMRVAMKVGTTLTYLNGDHLGSTALSTNSSGVFEVGQGYNGYGKYRTGGSLPTNYRYTLALSAVEGGQELDIPTGLMYYGARYYDRSAELTSKPHGRHVYLAGYSDPRPDACL